VKKMVAARLRPVIVACVLVQLFGLLILPATQAAELQVREHPSHGGSGGDDTGEGGRGDDSRSEADSAHGDEREADDDSHSDHGGSHDTPPASPAAGYFYDAGNLPPWVSPPYAALAPPRGPIFPIPNHATGGLLSKQVDFTRPIPPEPLFPLDDGNAAPRLPVSSLMYPYPLAWLQQQQNVGVNPPPVFIQKSENKRRTTNASSLKSRIRMARNQNGRKKKS